MTAEHTCGGRGATPCPACTATGKQSAFVERWRAEHSDEVYTTAWICPLCGAMIQTKHNQSILPAVIRSHQDGHGQDWLAYAALTDGGGSEGENDG